MNSKKIKLFSRSKKRAKPANFHCEQKRDCFLWFISSYAAEEMIGTALSLFILDLSCTVLFSILFCFVPFRFWYVPFRSWYGLPFCSILVTLCFRFSFRFLPVECWKYSADSVTTELHSFLNFEYITDACVTYYVWQAPVCSMNRTPLPKAQPI